MPTVLLLLKKRSNLLILLLIILIGLFFRTYAVVERLEFGHDGDLYSWIVKDIIVNHHFRLIGQLTSAPGIFIGGLFYYLLIPFFLLSNMDPIGGIFLSITISLVTLLSYYFVFSRLFNIKVGLIVTFLYAVLLSPVNSDRWVVPTITANLWTVWYFYTLICISRTNFKVLPLLGILIGLIWHVHIALIPTLIAVPISVILSKKIPNKKQIFTFLIFLFIVSSPFLLFELRHNFQQINAIVANFITSRDGATGFYKFTLVLEMINKNINTLLLAPNSFKVTSHTGFTFLILASAVLLIKNRVLQKKEYLIILSWILGVIAFFSISSSPISEYYFSNIEILFIYLLGLFLYLIFELKLIGKIIVLSLLFFLLSKNLFFIITKDYYNKGYLEKKGVVDFIDKDYRDKGFPCIGISYITALGENVGFRYFFYLKNTYIVRPSTEVPVYNIVIPDELSLNEVEKKFGHIGVITPKNIPSREIIEESCKTPETNSSDNMFGYTE